MSLASAVGRISICERTYIVIDESSRLRGSENCRESVSGVEPDRNTGVKQESA